MAPDYLDWVERNWSLLTRLTEVHTKLYKLSGGRIGYRVPGAPPMLLLDHVGARSGTHRTVPLVFGRDGEDVILVASKGGYPKHPAWFHNLKAHPDTTVQVGSRKLPVRARVATADEREHLWALMVKVYGGYETYQRRAEREIPLVVHEPR
jgi:deazaflavin-dependent oxidoreductase (nitroreductase family)